MNHPIILPYLNCHEYTAHAVTDCLTQFIPTTLLLIDNGSQQEGREIGESFARLHPDQVRRWRHDPPLPSLSATWNRALQWAWESGAGQALVINNDTRIWPGTYDYLLSVLHSTGALFVSATGVTQPQYEAFVAHPVVEPTFTPSYPLPGPDFSCFLIAKECHERYPFDESYIPAFCEDLDMHRRMMLAGDGGRIFGTGLPYLHYGSQTIKSLDREKQERLTRQIERGSRAYHLKKWGGPANGERFTVPFDPSSARDGVTTADLFERVRNGQAPL